jgi:hypothetical protein
VLLVLAGCQLVPRPADVSSEARILNETDQSLVIYWFADNGPEERIFELPPGSPGATISLPECARRGLLARTLSGAEFARRSGPTCGDWVITQADGP